MSAQRYNNGRPVETTEEKQSRLAREEAEKSIAKRKKAMAFQKNRAPIRRTAQLKRSPMRYAGGQARTQDYRIFRPIFLEDFRERFGFCAYCGRAPSVWWLHHQIPRSVAPHYRMEPLNCLGGCPGCGNMTDEVYKSDDSREFKHWVRDEWVIVPGGHAGWTTLNEKVLQIFPANLEWMRVHAKPFGYGDTAA